MKAFTSLHFSTSKYPRTLFQSCQISWGARSLAMPILSRHRSRPRVWRCRSPTGPAWCQHEAYSRLNASSLFWAFITDSSLGFLFILVESVCKLLRFMEIETIRLLASLFCAIVQAPNFEISWELHSLGPVRGQTWTGGTNAKMRLRGLVSFCSAPRNVQWDSDRTWFWL